MSEPSQQFAFDLPYRTAKGREDFFVSASNEDAVKLIEHWPDWGGRHLILTGPPGSGKSHLAAIWAEQAGAEVADARAIAGLHLNGNLAVEDIDALAGNRPAEETLFHLYNAATAAGYSLLLTSSSTPVSLGLSLPDLLSRLQSLPLVQLRDPDDDLLRAVLIKQFADRQVVTDARLLDYLLPRIERSFESVIGFVTDLDRYSLERKRPVTWRLAAELLGKTS